jgi:hypothetical protein
MPYFKAATPWLAAREGQPTILPPVEFVDHTIFPHNLRLTTYYAILLVGLFGVLSYPVTFNQEAWLIRDELSPKSSHSALSTPLIGLRLEGELDTARLEGVLNKIIERHAALRTAFLQNDRITGIEREARLQAYATLGLFAPGLYRQVVIPHATLRMDVATLSGAAYDSRDREIQGILENAFAPLDCQEPPLLRAVLFKVSRQMHILAITMHPLVNDPWCFRILYREVRELYQTHFNESGLCPPTSGVHFYQFALWQQERARKGYFDRACEFWRQQWAAFESAQPCYRDLPFALRKPTCTTNTLGIERVTIESELSRRIGEFARRSDTTVGTVMLAVLFILLHLYTQRLAISVFVSFRNRSLPGAESVIGWFANSHIIGIEISPKLTGREVLCKVQEATASAHVHEAIPQALLWNRLGRVPRRSDVSISFNIISADAENPRDERPSLIVAPATLPHPLSIRSSVGLSLSGVDKPAGLFLAVAYSLDRFLETDIRQLLEDLNRTVCALITKENELIRTYLSER